MEGEVFSVAFSPDNKIIISGKEKKKKNFLN